jgi:hypothetical protein
MVWWYHTICMVPYHNMVWYGTIPYDRVALLMLVHKVIYLLCGGTEKKLSDKNNNADF